MKVWDTDLLTRKSGGNDPVMDGLLFWLDGRDEIQNKIVHWNRPFEIQGYTKYESGTTYDRVSYQQVNITVQQTIGFDQQNGLIIPFMSDGNNYNVIFTPVSVQSGVKTSECYLYIGDDSGISKQLVPFKWRFDKRHPARMNDYYTVIPAGFVHIVQTSELKTYLNGSLVETDTAVSPLDISAFDTWAFYATDVTSLWKHTRAIGSVRYYNRVLSADEVLKNYAYEQTTGRIGL